MLYKGWSIRANSREGAQVALISPEVENAFYTLVGETFGALLLVQFGVVSDVRPD